MTRVVVCGGRGYGNREHVFSELDRYHQERGFTDLMQGGAYGADLFAREWLLDHPEVELWQFNAEWSKFGLSAGPIRNTRMKDWGPDLVLAFPGGTGTADMIKQARAAGIEVIEIKGGEALR